MPWPSTAACLRESVMRGRVCPLTVGIGTLLFDERDGRTTLTLTIACASKADRDALLAMRVDAGTLQTLENLSEHLARMSPQAG